MAWWKISYLKCSFTTNLFFYKNITNLDFVVSPRMKECGKIRDYQQISALKKLNFGSLGNLYPVSFFRLYDAYSFQMIPVLGEVIAGDWKSYQYLVESIRKFPDQVRKNRFFYFCLPVFYHCWSQFGHDSLQIKTILNTFLFPFWL